MADSVLPPPNQRRQMLSEASPRLSEVGRGFLEAGRWGEALECLSAAGDAEALMDLAGQAAEQGDFFYYLSAVRAAGAEPEPGTMEQLARTARQAGLERFAASAEKFTSPVEQDG